MGLHPSQGQDEDTWKMELYLKRICYDVYLPQPEIEVRTKTTSYY